MSVMTNSPSLRSGRGAPCDVRAICNCAARSAIPGTGHYPRLAHPDAVACILDQQSCVAPTPTDGPYPCCDGRADRPPGRRRQRAGHAPSSATAARGVDGDNTVSAQNGGQVIRPVAQRGVEEGQGCGGGDARSIGTAS